MPGSAKPPFMVTCTSYAYKKQHCFFRNKGPFRETPRSQVGPHPSASHARGKVVYNTDVRNVPNVPNIPCSEQTSAGAGTFGTFRTFGTFGTRTLFPTHLEKGKIIKSDAFLLKIIVFNVPGRFYRKCGFEAP